MSRQAENHKGRTVVAVFHLVPERSPAEVLVAAHDVHVGSHGARLEREIDQLDLGDWILHRGRAGTAQAPQRPRGCEGEQKKDRHDDPTRNRSKKWARQESAEAGRRRDDVGAAGRKAMRTRRDRCGRNRRRARAGWTRPRCLRTRARNGAAGARWAHRAGRQVRQTASTGGARIPGEVGRKQTAHGLRQVGGLIASSVDDVVERVRHFRSGLKPLVGILGQRLQHDGIELGRTQRVVQGGRQHFALANALDGLHVVLALE